ncbi:SAM-dependent methyltransferase [Enterococcus wangshanyuanii]|uniref:SAM-dependent methyltransferase n=1 Tax=Enterococcus wangshanyuanii TaxID=2005703 RepID=A0ABQ1PKL3_9ENTE|nr:class I SAM-dependent methyltransferase [Enterococcus wangshanyuanii]GGC98846.1 SAM-dependent methyltransferase [Enterococcus wangshanyuanii]
MPEKQIVDYFNEPKQYEKSEREFWLDPYISKQLLKAHLDQTNDGASRKLSVINRSVDWLNEVVPVAEFKRVIDLSCGPGLYPERLAKKKYDVTAIDFSKNSIDYARSAAEEQGLTIDYRCESYLSWKEQEQYDLALLIYCDYGALSPEDRKLLFENIYTSLKRGGKLILDVFSLQKLTNFQSENSWTLHDSDGFWSTGKHVVVTRNKKYDHGVTLEQTILLKEDDTIMNFNIWHQYFDLQKITSELEEASFEIVTYYADVCGNKYTEQSETICVIAEKKR